MAKTKVEFTYTIGGDIKFSPCYLHTNEDNLNVYATVEIAQRAGWTAYAYCRLRLQRYDNGKWSTISTKTGYVESGKNLNVSFTNIGKQTRSMRVLLDLYFDSARTDHAQLVIGEQWIR